MVKKNVHPKTLLFGRVKDQICKLPVTMTLWHMTCHMTLCHMTNIVIKEPFLVKLGYVISTSVHTQSLSFVTVIKDNWEVYTINYYSHQGQFYISITNINSDIVNQ